MTYLSNSITNYPTNYAHTHTVNPFTTAPITYDGLNRLIREHYVPALNNQLYRQEYPTKKEAMSTIDKIRAERREKRERAELENLFERWDEAQMGDYADGTVVTWTWRPKGEEKTYKYAALWANRQWHTTGNASPDGLDLEDWITWMIGKKVWPDALRIIHPQEQE